ncbi:MAG: hypothetical protein ACRBG0_27715 [Lewinella sp.]|uniref:hypothetical protein n=1 Tax=Lewinella sp. TaxID=2004506 RepID=UPI003D6BCAE6
MAKNTPEEQKTEINNLFPDNNQELIKPEDLRKSLDDGVDSTLYKTETTDNVPENTIPLMDEDGKFKESAISEDENFVKVGIKIGNKKKLKVAGSTIRVGSSIDASANGANLGIRDVNFNRVYIPIVSQQNNDATSARPFYRKRLEPVVAELQPIFDTQITANSFQFAVVAITGSDIAAIDRRFKCVGSASNIAMKIELDSYGAGNSDPDKIIYSDVDDGNTFNLSDGDNSILFDNPVEFREKNNQGDTNVYYTTVYSLDGSNFTLLGNSSNEFYLGSKVQVISDRLVNVSNGWESIADLTSETIPVTIDRNIWTQIPNDGDGIASNSNLSSSVTPYWDSDLNQFDFSSVDDNSWLYIEVELTVLPTRNNQRFQVRFVSKNGSTVIFSNTLYDSKIPASGGEVFTISDSTTIYKGSGIGGNIQTLEILSNRDAYMYVKRINIVQYL